MCFQEQAIRCPSGDLAGLRDAIGWTYQDEVLEACGLHTAAAKTV